jgi:two-component system NtrC family sensor kinase
MDAQGASHEESGRYAERNGTEEALRESEERCRQLQDRLIQAEKLASLGTLVSGMAHEINNPTQGILGMAELVLEEQDPATIREYTQDIIAYSKHIATVVRDFACYARSNAHEDAVDVDLCDRLTEAVKMVRRCPHFGTVEVVTQFQPIPRLRARRVEIDQVFINLLSNAVQAMDGRGRLDLATYSQNGTMFVRISDTGCGIPKALMHQIFDPFFTTKDPGKGTGLGLSIVYQIVNQYGGTIGIKSEEGNGSTFTVQFPAENHSEEAHDGAAGPCYGKREAGARADSQ